MKDDYGFGVVPVPVYKEGDKYLTQVHNIATCGAISIKTQKFSQCTAFLNYQSTHSNKVLEEYYKFNVMRGLATNSEGIASKPIKFIQSTRIFPLVRVDSALPCHISPLDKITMLSSTNDIL